LEQTAGALEAETGALGYFWTIESLILPWV
jgi:hypothetical protein